MARLFPLDTGDPCDTGVPCEAGAHHGMGNAATTGASPTREQGGFATRVQATGLGSCAQSGVVSAPSSADAVHVSTPPQSLTSGPWRIPGDEGVLQPPFEVTGPHSSLSPSPSSHSPISSRESRNPSDSFRITAEGGQGAASARGM
jgi:hypothetical protein